MQCVLVDRCIAFFSFHLTMSFFAMFACIHALVNTRDESNDNAGLLPANEVASAVPVTTNQRSHRCHQSGGTRDRFHFYHRSPWVTLPLTTRTIILDRLEANAE